MWAWTVNEADAVERLVRMGIDGIITDDCPLARRVVDRDAAAR